MKRRALQLEQKNGERYTLLRYGIAQKMGRQKIKAQLNKIFFIALSVIEMLENSSHPGFRLSNAFFFFNLLTEEINRGLHAFEFYRTVNNRVMVASVRANSAAEDVSNTKNPMIYFVRCSEKGKQYLYCLSFVSFTKIWC